MKRICHISSVHKGLDVRIYFKECISLAQAGYEVHLIIPACTKDVTVAQEKGVKIHPIPIVENRLVRPILQSWRCLREIVKLKAEVYHFHDPELIPLAVITRTFGKIALYDVHEDVPSDIMSKEWIPEKFRGIIAKMVNWCEKIGAHICGQIIAATPFIKSRFCKYDTRVTTINNYPAYQEIDFNSLWGAKSPEFCFAGVISKIRGINQLLDALERTDNEVKLSVCGRFDGQSIESECREHQEWKKVNYFGQLQRSEVSQIYSNSIAGIVTFLPEPNHINAQPNKMFEYMNWGLPVIASDFPLWREIIEKNKCGLLVDPENPADIALALDYLYEHPEEAKEMGVNGRNAVKNIYNWEDEEKKLLSLYSDVFKFSIGSHNIVI